MRARICYQCVLPPPDMIVSGAPVPAEKLARAGLFDEVIEGDLHEGALRFAARVADRRPLPLVRDRRVEHPSAEGFLAFALRRGSSRTRSSPSRR